MKVVWSLKEWLGGQRSTSIEHRPEMAKRSKEVPMARGKDPHQNSETSQHTPREEKHMSRATEMPVTEKESPTKSDLSVAEQSSGEALSLQNTSSGASSSGVKVKPASFDGSTSWLDYKTHFDMCAELNGWNDKQKGLHLAVSLRGQAQGVLGNLPAGDRENFEKLAKALSERVLPESHPELYRAQLKERQLDRES